VDACGLQAARGKSSPAESNAHLRELEMDPSFVPGRKIVVLDTEAVKKAERKVGPLLGYEGYITNIGFGQVSFKIERGFVRAVSSSGPPSPYLGEVRGRIDQGDFGNYFKAHPFADISRAHAELTRASEDWSSWA
jgi:hypothetical protein